MRLVFAAVALLLSGSSTAQILTSSAGNAATGTSGYVVYSVGEAVIDTYEAASSGFTYGFNQPIPGTIGVLENLSPTVTVFPNPTTAILVVEAKSGSTILIYDALGKQVFYRVMNEDALTCDLQHLTPGPYTMQVQLGRESSVIKLIKI